MVDPTELNGRVREGLERRFARVGDLAYLLPIRGRGGYRLMPGERKWLIAGWEERTAGARRFLKISVYANIPFILLEMILIGAIPPLNWFVHQYDGLLMGLLLLAGLPLTGLVVHYRSVRAANAWLVEAVGDRPLIDDPYIARPPGYDRFDRAGIGLLGVRLAMEIYSRFVPAAIPHVGPLSPASLILSAMIVGWFVLRWRYRAGLHRFGQVEDAGGQLMTRGLLAKAHTEQK